MIYSSDEFKRITKESQVKAVVSNSEILKTYLELLAKDRTNIIFEFVKEDNDTGNRIRKGIELNGSVAVDMIFDIMYASEVDDVIDRIRTDNLIAFDPPELLKKYSELRLDARHRIEAEITSKELECAGMGTAKKDVILVASSFQDLEIEFKLFNLLAPYLKMTSSNFELTFSKSKSREKFEFKLLGNNETRKFAIKQAIFKRLTEIDTSQLHFFFDDLDFYLL